MSTTKRRNVPPPGYRLMKMNEEIDLDRGDTFIRESGEKCPRAVINCSAKGHRVGEWPNDYPHDDHYTPWITPLPAKPARAKKRKSQYELAKRAAENIRCVSEDYRRAFKAGWFAGFAAAQRRAKGGAK